MHSFVTFVEKYGWWGVIGLVIVFTLYVWYEKTRQEEEDLTEAQSSTEPATSKCKLTLATMDRFMYSAIVIAVLAALWYYGGVWLVFSLFVIGAVAALWFTDHRDAAKMAAITIVCLAIVGGAFAWGHSLYEGHEAKKTQVVEEKKKPTLSAEVEKKPAVVAKDDSGGVKQEAEGALHNLVAKAEDLAGKLAVHPKIGPGDSAYRAQNPIGDDGIPQPIAPARPGKQSDGGTGADTSTPNPLPTFTDIKPMSGNQGDLQVRLLRPCWYSQPDEVMCRGYISYPTHQDIWLDSVVGKYGAAIPRIQFAVYGTNGSFTFDGGGSEGKLIPGSQAEFSFTFRPDVSEMPTVATFDVIYSLDGRNHDAASFVNVPIDLN